MIDHLIKRFNIDNTSLCPACSSVKLRSREAEDVEIDEPCRQAVGSMIWLADMSRPDRVNTVHDTARHMSKPDVEHWKTFVRILRYLKHTWFDGLVLGKGESGELHVYADSDYARDPDNTCSAPGAAVMFRGAAILVLSSSVLHNVVK